MASSIVVNVQGYSIHDGPGIRTVVFLKGCPLRCKWCANPENLSPDVQIGFLEKLCTGCGRCAKACTQGAISLVGNIRIERKVCTGCAACTQACYYGALVQYGKEETADAVFHNVHRDKIFYDQSGGGVTVSGGEPLIYPDFVSELFTLCHAAGIHTCIETCGHVPPENMRQVLATADLFYFDLKQMDSGTHKAYTGVDNNLILTNAEMLVRSGAEVMFRQPLIPGINDGEDNIRATAEFIKALDAQNLKLQLMPYHRLGSAKYDALNLPYEMADTQPTSPEVVNAVMTRYQDLGVNCSISK